MFINPGAVALGLAGEASKSGLKILGAAGFASGSLSGVLDLASIPGNLLLQVKRPPPSELLAAFTRGLIGKSVASKGLAMDGIDWAGPNAGGGASFVWDQVRKLGEATIDPDHLYSLFNAGDVDRDTLDLYLLRNALRDPVVKGMMDRLRFAVYDNLTCAALAFRDYISDDEWTYHLNRNGVITADHVKGFKQVARYVPSPIELAHFMIRDADNADIVERFQYDKYFDSNFRDQLKLWAKWQGVDEKIMRYEWRSHLTLPSPGQAATMMFRLRNDKTLPIYQQFPDAKPFTLADAQYVMRAAGIAPGVIDGLIASQSPIVSFRQMRNLVKYGGWKVHNVIGAFRDQGYSDSIAQDLGVAYYKASKATALDPVQRIGRAHVEEALTLGIMAPNDARGVLKTYGLDIDEAAVAVSSIQAEIEINTVKESVAACRRNYLRGIWDLPTTQTAMDSLGMDGSAVRRYIDLWTLDLQSGRKQLSIEKAGQAYVKGIISLVDLRDRLDNLGYGASDALVFLALQVAAREDAIARALEKQAKADDAAKRAKYKGVSPPLIARWLRAGKLTRSQAIALMHEIGISSPFAELILDEAGSSLPDALAKIEAKHKAKMGEIEATERAKESGQEQKSLLTEAEIAVKEQAKEQGLKLSHAEQLESIEARKQASLAEIEEREEATIEEIREKKGE